jgi:hypothetical protein
MNQFAYGIVLVAASYPEFTINLFLKQQTKKKGNNIMQEKKHHF